MLTTWNVFIFFNIAPTRSHDFFPSLEPEWNEVNNLKKFLNIYSSIPFTYSISDLFSLEHSTFVYLYVVYIHTYIYGWYDGWFFMYSACMCRIFRRFNLFCVCTLRVLSCCPFNIAFIQKHDYRRASILDLCRKISNTIWLIDFSLTGLSAVSMPQI